LDTKLIIRALENKSTTSYQPDLFKATLRIYQSTHQNGLYVSLPANRHPLTPPANPPVDYYATLDLSSGASQQQIRDAYKRAALKHHPDRVPADSPERATRTRKFQQINDAYYTLSDPTRRRDYDAARTNFGFGGSGHYSAPQEEADEEVPRPEAGQSSNPFGGFPWSAFGFGGQAKDEGDREKYSSEQFGSVFEEMLRYVLDVSSHAREVVY